MNPQEKEPQRTKRINLVISPDLDDELNRLSKELDTSKVDLERHAIKLALNLYRIAADPEGRVYFQEPGEERVRIRFIL